MRKILAYYRPLQRPQGWRNLAARRGRVEGPWTLWRYTRALQVRKESPRDHPEGGWMQHVAVL